MRAPVPQRNRWATEARTQPGDKPQWNRSFGNRGSTIQRCGGRPSWLGDYRFANRGGEAQWQWEPRLPARRAQSHRIRIPCPPSASAKARARPNGPP